jgi:hypothetical protein
MQSKIGPAMLVFAVLAGCATGPDGNDGPGSDSDGSPSTLTVSKNQSFLAPLDDAKVGGGYLLRVPLTVPSGRIFSVDYTCAGADCPHVFECPDGSHCGPDHPHRITYDGGKAMWWGWTDVGMVGDATLTFKIHFTDAEPPPKPPC